MGWAAGRNFVQMMGKLGEGKFVEDALERSRQERLQAAGVEHEPGLGRVQAGRSRRIDADIVQAGALSERNRVDAARPVRHSEREAIDGEAVGPIIGGARRQIRYSRGLDELDPEQRFIAEALGGPQEGFYGEERVSIGRQQNSKAFQVLYCGKKTAGRLALLGGNSRVVGEVN